jgi:transposase
MKPKMLNDHYKEHLSNYRSWNQLPHADEYIYFRENLGENISIDETAFSNGELYTIVTNKSGHGKHGTVIAMIKGTKSDEVCRHLMKLPKGRRKMVKNITLDMAGSMKQIAKRCFPNATQIIDRFHIQMQMQEALQDLRVQYRWQAIEQENTEIKKAKSEKRKYVPQCFENGDTLRQLLVRSRYLLFKAPEKWTSSQKVRAEILFKQFDDIKQFYYLSLQLGQIYSHNYDKNLARGKLALWFNKIEEWNYPQFNSVIDTFKNHYDRILNFFKDRLTNASAESFNAKLKSFRATFRGVDDVKFYLYRVMKLYA